MIPDIIPVANRSTLKSLSLILSPETASSKCIRPALCGYIVSRRLPCDNSLGQLQYIWGAASTLPFTVNRRYTDRGIKITCQNSACVMLQVDG